MQGDPTLIGHLNTVLRNELTAINQYFLHARMLDNWGVSKLGKHERDESIVEMKHAERIIDRILFLEGLPNLQDLDRLSIGEKVGEIIDCDLKLELKALADLRAAISHAELIKDYDSRYLLQSILHEEEQSVDFLEIQGELIKRMGLENYTQLQSGSAS